MTCDMKYIDPKDLNFRRKRQSTSDTQIENIMQVTLYVLMLQSYIMYQFMFLIL